MLGVVVGGQAATKSGQQSRNMRHGVSQKHTPRSADGVKHEPRQDGRLGALGVATVVVVVGFGVVVTIVVVVVVVVEVVVVVVSVVDGAPQRGIKSAQQSPNVRHVVSQKHDPPTAPVRKHTPKHDGPGVPGPVVTPCVGIDVAGNMRVVGRADVVAVVVDDDDDGTVVGGSLVGRVRVVGGADVGACVVVVVVVVVVVAVVVAGVVAVMLTVAVAVTIVSGYSNASAMAPWNRRTPPLSEARWPT